MKVRAVPILSATAKNEKNPQPMGNWLRGNGKHSENSRKKLKIPLKNCKTGRRRRENAHQAAQQKSPTDLKWLDISIKRTWKIGHRLRWFCAIQQRQEAVAQGKNPSAAASLRLNASRSTKTLAIDPLLSKKQITQTGPSE